MKRIVSIWICLLCLLSPYSSLFAESADVVISATDIPSNLKKAVGIKLVGEWGSEEFAELPLALGTSGF
ncbi:hypothetical protein ACFO3G_03600, partial [Falsiporphyromonas endometrii]